jgi:hypothetical protein
MTNRWPEYYVSKPPEDADDLTPVYYKVTGKDPDGHVFWRRESMSRPKETSFYDLLMEERGGFGLELVSVDETPWDE